MGNVWTRAQTNLDCQSSNEHSSTKVHESFELLNGPGSSLQIINHSILNVKCMSQNFATHTYSCTDSTVLLRKLEIEYHK